MGKIIRSLLVLTCSILLLVAFFFMASVALVVGALIAIVMGGVWLWITRTPINADSETMSNHKRPKWWVQHYERAEQRQHQDGIDGGRTTTSSVIEGTYHVVHEDESESRKQG